jgi:nicotinamide-nucleotide amidase
VWFSSEPQRFGCRAAEREAVMQFEGTFPADEVIMINGKVDAEGLGRTLQDRGWSVATAESLTGGLLADSFARLPDAADWFRGGVVAYAAVVKRELLGIGDAPVVSEAAARAMATAAGELLGAQVTVAVTGVGGPDPEDGVDPGTVWMATAVPGHIVAVRHEFHGDPRAVCEQTCHAAVAAIRDAVAAASR